MVSLPDRNPGSGSFPKSPWGTTSAAFPPCADLEPAEGRQPDHVPLEGLIADISADLINLASGELDAGIDRALRHLGQVANADRSYLFLLNPEDGTMDNTHEWCAVEAERHRSRLQGVPCAAFPWWMGKLSRQECLALPSLGELPPEARVEWKLLASQDTKSLLVAPIAVRGGLQGFLGLETTRQGRSWPSDLSALLKVVGGIIGAAVARARADEALAKAHDELERRVEQRTTWLRSAYASLKAEVEGREVADAARREAEAQLAHAQRIESVGTLAGGMAHDFNNLLAIIMGHAELLLTAHELSPAAGAHVQDILNQSQRCADLVRQILDFSRRSPSDRCPTDVSQLATETAEMLQRIIPESVRITSHCPEPHLHASVDRTQMLQVLTNLAVNARDAMPGGGTVDIATRPFDLRPDEAPPVAGMTPGPWVLITVADTGTGIAPEVLDRIFEPYFTTKDVGKGTGLGLSQVYGIVQLHRGFLHVESVLNQGTTVSIYLGETPVVPSRGAAEVRHDEMPRGQGQTILYVEDEWPVRKVLEELLRTLNYIPLAAADGEEALRLYEAHQHQIAAVISDVVMPGMSCLDLCREIRACDPQMRIMLMSGYPRGAHATELNDLKVDSWLMKPACLSELAQQLAKILSTPSDP